MVKAKFKVGDKVKLNGTRSFYCLGNNPLTIDHFEEEFIMVEYGRRDAFPLLASEIEYAVKVGQQLLFSFMK